MPSPEAIKQSKRDEIVEIASQLFYRQGYGATGIKQIIEEASIAKGTFYTHFKSKEDLGLEWLRSRHLQWNAWLDDALKPVDESGAKILAAFTESAPSDVAITKINTFTAKFMAGCLNRVRRFPTKTVSAEMLLRR